MPSRASKAILIRTNIVLDKGTRDRALAMYEQYVRECRIEQFKDDNVTGQLKTSQ